MPQQVDYELTLDDSQVKKRLRDTRGRFIKMGETGDDAMKKMGASGVGMSNIMQGAVTGVFATLTGAVLNFTSTAINAFAEVVKSSTKMAVEFDVTRKKFISIFEGGEDEADAVMEKIGKKASELGLDMNQALSISRSFLPDIKGTEDPLGEIDNLLVAVRGLAEEDPMQGVKGARIAIDEAMSGTLRSIRDRFEFTGAEIDILKAAQAQLGDVVGTIEGINQVMKRRGIDVEALKGTFTQAVGEMGFAVSKLQIELGKPIAAEMTDQITALNEIMSENSDDMLLFAGSMGDATASIFDFVSSGLLDFLSELDFAKVVELGEKITVLIEKIRLVMDVLFDMPEANSSIDSLGGALDWLINIFNMGAKAAALLKAEMLAIGADIGNLVKQFKALSSRVNVFVENITDEELQKSLVDSNKIFEDSMRDSMKAFDQSSERIEANKTKHEERIEAQNKDTTASLAAAEAYLKQGDAAEKASQQLEKLGVTDELLQDAQEILTDGMEKELDLRDSFAKDRLKLEKDHFLDGIDLARKFSQERAKLIQDSLDDVEDIERGHQDDVEDLGIDLARSEKAVIKSQGKDRLSAEKDAKKKLLQIEQDYRRTLDQITRDSIRTLEDAERSLDAKAFVEALRQQEIAKEEAGVKRDETIEDARSGFDERIDDLKVAQESEREQIRIAHDQRVADLALSLERELEAQFLSDERKFESQIVNEAIRVEEMGIAHEREKETQLAHEEEKLAALEKSTSKKLEKLTEGLDEEVAAVIEAEAAKVEVIEEFAETTKGIILDMADDIERKIKKRKDEEEKSEKTPGRFGDREKEAPGKIRKRRLGGEFEDPDAEPEILFLPLAPHRARGGAVSARKAYVVGERGTEGYIPHRLFGGDVRRGQPTFVGESGRELFFPPTSGTIVPNSQLSSFRDRGASTTQNISNVRNELGGFSVSQSMLSDPVERAKLEQFMLEILAKGSSR